MNKKRVMPSGKDVLKSFREWIHVATLDTNKNGWDSSLGWGVLSVSENIF
jgi:hypothetical protein